MGRKTYESIGKPLPGRINLVLTRDARWRTEGVTVVHSVEEALARTEPELACIGGAEVFKLFMPLATRIYLTRIDADIPGDAVFPPIDALQWREVEQRRFAADARNAYDMTFVTLERVPAAAA
jgi:dihydrofolate reductase